MHKATPSPCQDHFKPSKLRKEIVATDTVHLMVANGNFAQITAGYVRYSTISSDFAGQRNGNVDNADIARAKSTLFVYMYSTNFIRNTHN